ncbi:MAG: hypothetical protein AAGI17_06410 [Planctomycetota bacterium]
MIAMMFAGLVLGGCAGGGLLSDIADRPAIKTAGSGVPAAWIYPAGPRSKVQAEFAPDSTETEIGRVRTDVSAVVDDAMTVAVSRIEPAIDEPLLRESTLVVGADGSISLAAVRSVENEATGGSLRHFRYEPPLGFAPAVLEPGTVFESSAAMIQHRADDPESVLLRGEVARTSRLLSRDEIAELFGTDAPPELRGVLDVQRIKLGPARVEQRTAKLIEPGVGAVVELEERTVRVFGLVTSSRSVLLKAIDD